MCYRHVLKLSAFTGFCVTYSTVRQATVTAKHSRSFSAVSICTRPVETWDISCKRGTTTGVVSYNRSGITERSTAQLHTHYSRNLIRIIYDRYNYTISFLVQATNIVPFFYVTIMLSSRLTPNEGFNRRGWRRSGPASGCLSEWLLDQNVPAYSITIGSVHLPVEVPPTTTCYQFGLLKRRRFIRKRREISRT